MRPPLVVPCHRVLAAGGPLAGYGGGLERKRALLDWEAGIGAVGLAEMGVIIGLD